MRKRLLKTLMIVSFLMIVVGLATIGSAFTAPPAGVVPPPPAGVVPPPPAPK